MARTHVLSPLLSQQLLLNVAEELKLPFEQIARKAEAGRLHGEIDLQAIESTADMALKLLDNYCLGVRLNLETDTPEIEAVSVSSVLYDTGQQLYALAKSYGVSLELDIAGRFGPVAANRQVLEAALVSLGSSLIEALPALESRQLRLQLATHRSRYGIVAGIYGDSEQLTASALEKGRQLSGRSRQPLLGITHTSGAGIFVADTLLNAMQLSLQTTRHHGLFGLGTVLQTNNQLQLV
jgi:hypothetical protein